MRLSAKAYHCGYKRGGAQARLLRAPPPAAWARAQRERDKRGLALAPRNPRYYTIATRRRTIWLQTRGRQARPLELPLPPRRQRERDSLLALWASALMRGLHHAPMLSCLVGYRHARAPLSPARHAFLPCGLPSRVGYSAPTRRCLLALWATLMQWAAPTRLFALWATVTRGLRSHPSRRCLLALWATLMRGTRSLSKPP